MKTWKVYTWTEQREGHQARHICAVHSKRELAQMMGLNKWENNLVDTGNRDEINVAMKKPYVIFWKPPGSENWRELSERK